nr:cytidine deaminase-like isoform X1 [Dermacentor andersoni]
MVVKAGSRDRYSCLCQNYQRHNIMGLRTAAAAAFNRMRERETKASDHQCHPRASTVDDDKDKAIVAVCNSVIRGRRASPAASRLYKLHMADQETQKLVKLAQDMRARAYCNYSKVRVGAALLCEDGTIFTGCNVENASYGLTICAERTALVKAVSEGHRTFKAIAVASSAKTLLCTLLLLMGGFRQKEPMNCYRCHLELRTCLQSDIVPMAVHFSWI